MSDDILYYLAFSHFLGIGPHRFKKLRQHLGSVKDSYQASNNTLKNLLGPVIGEKFITFRNRFNPEKKVKEIMGKKITIVTQEDKYYPQNLNNISDSPICLYIRGEKQLLLKDSDGMFAIVGTRNPTSYGKTVTQQFASELARSGFTIVSGMALGIDGLSHQAALDAHSTTIAVLGCGVDIIHPPSHRNLYEQIVNSGSIVLSEFPPGMIVQKGFFVARNRIISGLSRGILVVEGAVDSGSLITARYAAEQGRDVFAPPSPITSHYSQAPNRLIKEGAIMVTSPRDILNEYQIKPKRKLEEKHFQNRSPLEKSILTKLASEPFDSDGLVRFLQIPLPTLLSTLTTLELDNIIEKNREGKYTLASNYL